MLTPKVEMWLGFAVEALFNCLLIAGMTWLIWSYISSGTFDEDMIRWGKLPYTLRLRFNATLFTLTLGAILFIIKYFAQFYYGLLETAFAVATCLLTVDGVHAAYAMGKTPQGIWFGFASSLYLLVRGLSNIVEGWKKDDTNLKKVITDKIKQIPPIDVP